LRLWERRNDEVDPDERPGCPFGWSGIVKLPGESRADGAVFVIIGANVQMTRREGHEDRETGRGNGQDEAPQQQPPATGGQVPEVGWENLRGCCMHCESG
jgi:hypothetical protein